MIFKNKLGGRRSKSSDLTDGPRAAEQEGTTPEDRVKMLSRITSLMVGIAIVAAGYGLFTGISATKTTSELKEDTVPSLCAAVDIPAGTVISAEMVTLKQMPRGYAVSAPVGDSAIVVGQQTLVAIPAGAQITTTSLTGARNTATLADNLTPGTVGTSIAIDAESGVAGTLHQGDLVLITASYEEGSPRAGTNVIADGARVAALDSLVTGDSNAYSSVSVEVTRETAISIRDAQANDGKIGISLISKANAQ